MITFQDFSTHIWPCPLGSDVIPAQALCDGKPDCKQAEDEDEKTCFGSSGINYYVLGIIIVYFTLGTVAYLGKPTDQCCHSY